MELVQEKGVWRVNKPIKGLADPDKISGMLRKIKNLRVMEFVEDAPKDLARFELDKPLSEITLWDSKDGSSKTVLFGKEAEKNTVHAMRKGRDTVYTVSNSVLGDLKLKPQEFRKKHE